MKFSCDRCHKPYASRGDPVPGRVYRIGCRCGHIIVLGPYLPALPSSAPAASDTASWVGGSQRRAAPPPLPWARTRSPGALDEPRGAEPFESPGPAARALAPDPKLAVLAATPTPSPLPVDDEMLIPLPPPECRAPSVAGTLARAARASFEAGIAAWRSERASSRALRAALADGRHGGASWRSGASIAAWQRQRTSLGTLLAACTASMVAAALLTSWALAVMPRRGGETTATVPRVVAATPDAAPGAAADERVARAEGHGPPLLAPAAAPARSGRREAARPVRSVPRELETDDEVAAPVRAEAADAPQTAAEAVPSAVAVPSEPAADARPDAAPETAAPDPPTPPNGDAEPEDEGAPLATAPDAR